MGVVFIGDTPETIADRRATQTRLRQLISMGNALVGQRDAFKGKLTKRELILRHQLDTSARSYRDEVIGMLAEYPDLRSMGNLPELVALRNAFSVPWGTHPEAEAGVIIIAIRIVVLAAAAAYLVGAIYYVRKWSR